MADPLSIIGGIAAIVQISSTVADLFKAVKDASSERQKLLAEINATTALCQTLRDYAEIDAKPWTKTFQILCNNGSGPVDQFYASLNYLQKKLATGQKEISRKSSDGGQALAIKSHINSWVQSLKWPFTKDEVHQVLADIKRQNSLLNLALTNDNLRLSAAIRDEVGKISKGLDTICIHQEDEKRKISLFRLTTIDFEGTQGDVSSRRAKGTGQWLLRSEQFESWLVAYPSTTLWCRGIPGSGKTVLTSLVIDHLRLLKENDPSVGVAGIYCSYADPQPTKAMLGSVLQQLAGPLADIPHSVSEIDAPSIRDISKALSDVISLYRQVFVIVDALDECIDNIDLSKELRKLDPTTSNTALRILITSRSGIMDVERIIKADKELEIRSNDNDVRLYLQETLRDQEHLSRWISDSPEFEASIIDAILSRLSGMFLLAHLYVDLLASARTKRGVRKALETLPEGTDDTYAEAWDRICAQKTQHADIGRKVLSWIICASRPLSVQELRYGLAIEQGDTQLVPDGLLDVDDLTSFCAGLVVIDEQRNQMRLVHLTTNEYFAKRKGSLLPEADDTIAVACITHLLMDTFKAKDPCLMPDDDTDHYRQHPLYGYAATNWGTHARISASDTSLDLSLRLLKDEKARTAAFRALVLHSPGALSCWAEPGWHTVSCAEIEADDTMQSWSGSSKSSVGALHLAAYFGIVDLGDCLLGDDSSINEPDRRGATSLYWAIVGSQHVMLQFLVERGASVHHRNETYDLRIRRSWRDGYCFSPLHLASSLGNIEAIKLLLRHQAAIDKVLAGRTALATAVENDQLAAAELLLAHGADVNIAHSGFINAAQYGNSDMLKLLVGRGASSSSLQRSLEYAAKMCDYDELVLLLDAGVNVDGIAACERRPVPDGTPVEWDDVLENTDAALDNEDNLASVPLIQIVNPRWGDEVVKCCMLLINAGADVNRIGCREYTYTNDWDWVSGRRDLFALPSGRKTTPLHTAVYFGNLEMGRMLVRRGADINFSLGKNYTALTSALHSEGYNAYLQDTSVITSSLRERAMLQLLVDLGANPDLCAVDDKARIEKLLNMSPDNCEFLRALQRVVAESSWPEGPRKKSFRSRVRKLKRLLQEGADPRLCCEKGQRTIENFLSWSEEDIEKLDYERRCTLEARKEKGQVYSDSSDSE